MFRALLLLVLLGCTHPKPDEKPDFVPAPGQPTYEEAADRMLGMADRGWIVSRGTGGSVEHKGDSLLFTGLAMGVLDCERGKVPEAALFQMFKDTDYGFYRHPDIPGEWSLDGALGVYWGALQRIGRCPDARKTWNEALLRNRERIKLEPYFSVVLDSAIAETAGENKPSPEDRGALGAEVAGWAIAVVSHREAAYRLHLGFLALDVVDAPKGRVAFCEAVKPAKMPLLEDFCERGSSLLDFADNWKPNVWEYALQRSPEWEAPDGQGLETPGLDLLMAYYRLSRN